MNPKNKLLNALLALQAAVPQLVDGTYKGRPMLQRSCGICCNVMSLLYGDQYTQEMFFRLMEDWPSRHSEHFYPVGGSINYEMDREYGTLWQNPRRIELLNWLIKELRNETD